MTISANDIKAALNRGELVFYYQPKVEFLTGRISGAEALMRWTRDDGEVVPAGTFIPAVEAAGLLPTITAEMFPRLVEDFNLGREQGADTTVALNISASDLHSEPLLELILEAIRDGVIQGERLQLEVTEGAVVSSSRAILRDLEDLTAAGIGLSMDDYGKGFSSLETLNRLPFSEIKMDQSFVMRIQRSPKSATLVKASVAMAQMLGAKTVVEGIESEGVYHALLHSGCTEGQGYWISEPLPLSDYLAFLDADMRWPASPVGLLRVTQIALNWQHDLLLDAVFAFLQSERIPEETLRGLHISHTDCALGRWYYGAGRQFTGEPEFDALEQPHRRMHDICVFIVAAIRDRPDRAMLEQLLAELSSDACQVSTHLQSLETRLLIRELQ